MSQKIKSKQEHWLRLSLLEVLSKHTTHLYTDHLGSPFQTGPKTPSRQPWKTFKLHPRHRSLHNRSPLPSFSDRTSDLHNLPAAGRCSPFWKKHASGFRESRGTLTPVQPIDLTDYQAMLDIAFVSSAVAATTMAFFHDKIHTYAILLNLH